MAAALQATTVPHLGSSTAGKGDAQPGAPSWRRYRGRADQAAVVRAWLAGELVGCPAVRDVVLMADELVCNAIQHSNTRKPGGVFRVLLQVLPGELVRVEVADAGGAWARPGWDSGPDGGGEADGYWCGGRGLRIVAALAAAWGVQGDDGGRTVWFTVGWDG